MDEGRAGILFDGVRYDWWQSAEVRASVDDLCASLSMRVTLPGHGDGLGLTPNTVIKAMMGGSLAATVRLDKLQRSVGKDSHDISIDGRSIARELVDSQYSKTLSGLTLADISKRLCDDFNVPLKVLAKTQAVEEFAMQCEAPANALINAARAANLLFYPSADGGLVLAAPSDAAPVAALRYGEHILSYEVVDEYAQRFSEYCVKGENDGENAPFGKAFDKGITHFRPMHIMADRHGQGQGGCERRAEMERNRRLARAHRIELDVQGWRYLDRDGGWRLWDINTQARVEIPHEGIGGVFLIGERSFKLDGKGGHTTRLVLMRREAFLQGKGK
jgi:prophage tail gpP-like protein